MNTGLRSVLRLLIAVFAVFVFMQPEAVCYASEYDGGSIMDWIQDNPDFCVPETETETSPELPPEIPPEIVPEQDAELNPEVSPEAVPDEVPEATPEVVPEPAPEAVPEPLPEITPEPSPEITPVPDVEPEIKLEDSSEAEPEVLFAPLPENTSRYIYPKGYNLFDIYYGSYTEGPLYFADAMHMLEAELAEAIGRITDALDTTDVVLRYNDGDAEQYQNMLPEIAAAFCATEGWDDPEELISDRLTADEINRLRRIYWSMLKLEPLAREDVFYSYSDIGAIESETLYCLQIDISIKTAQEYFGASIDPFQQDILNLLLTDAGRTRLLNMSTGKEISNNNKIEKLIAALPAGLDETRKNVVKAACSLVDKIPYFWGGVSDMIGWDDGWNVPRMVTSSGSYTEGTIRPYGLDCSGYVTWTLINGAESMEAIDHIAHGTVNQFNKCVEIPMESVIPGDLVFAYGDDCLVGHVGIVVGRDDNGELLICHCTSEDDKGVVLEALSETDCTIAARPLEYYNYF